MKKLLLMALAAVLAACSAPMTTPEDAGEELPPPAYDGDTVGGTIPELPMNPEPLIDAGPIVTDGTCCDTHFHISDEEPADATGRLVSGLAALAELPLERDGGEWTVTACFPVNQSATYRYEFSWDAGIEDGGSAELEDGGVEWFEIHLVGASARASDAEPGFVDSNGDRWNFYRAVSSCDGLDGSVPP